MLRIHAIIIVFFSLSFLSFVTPPASAAPIWIERNYILPPVLIDDVFAQSNDASTRTIDHTLFDDFLTRNLVARTDGLNIVKYRHVSTDDQAQLASYIQALEAINIDDYTRNEQLAFWINLYNAATIHLIITSEEVSSIRDLKKPWNTKIATVLNLDLTLNEIEHGIIRPVFKDARIHYAVNCASIGCPNLAERAYTGKTLEMMLNEVAIAYINHPRGVRVKGGRITASKIFGWYREDFGDGVKGVLNHIQQYANEDLKSAIEGKSSIAKYKYDWDLNGENAELTR